MFAKLFVFAIAAVVLCSAADPPKFYTTDYEGFDVDALVKDPARMKLFKECVIGDGECSPLAASFKKDLADALVTNCEKCSDAHKVTAKKLVTALKETYPEAFLAAIKKIDPESKHWPQFEKTISA